MIIYETTCISNNKKYIGKDKNNDPNYLGSGTALKCSIKKYGRENFKKIILEYCKNEDHLDKREIYWIDHYNAVSSRDYYNMKDGGTGGDCPYFHSNEFKEIMSKVTTGKNNGMFNKKHKPESIQKQKDKAKGRFSLQWFIERNGELEGTKRWKERNNKLSRDRIGENNFFYGKTFEYEKHPRYIDIPKDVLKRLIKEGLDGVKLAKHFNTTTTTIYKKVNHYWNCKMSKLVF